MTHTYQLKNLPENIQKTLLSSYHAKNIDEHRESLITGNFMKKPKEDEENNLFGSFFADDFTVEKNDKPNLEYVNDNIIWATDNYIDKGVEYNFDQPIHNLSVIVPRVEKSKVEQKRRVKEKAEVFTPSWVCNEQNNLIDNHILYEGAFNTVSEDKKEWFPNKDSVKFSKDYTWLDYIVSRRLEMTAGEAPYLMSPYDTTTGDTIPVRDSDGSFQRIGVLDRKLRVVSENAEIEKWYDYALVAMLSTFGYEWQGDNLLLARLNFLNTFIEYYFDAVGEFPKDSMLLDVAEVASWNIWQMDGLKMVVPETCSSVCQACKKKKRIGHDGRVSTIRFLSHDGSFVLKNFEDFVFNNSDQKF